MSRDGKSTGTPRLSVVEGSGGAASRTPPAESFDQPANDAAPAAEPGSPVHELIDAIEAGSIEAGSIEAMGEDAPQRAPAVPGERVRVLEAVIFASAEPIDEARLQTYLKPGEELAPLLAELQALYAGRGVNLVHVAGKWAFRTAEDVSWALERHARQERRLSRAALETLAIVAYHQPTTRAEIEEVRGVSISKGTLDVLMEIGWVRPRGRRRAPGKPITYGTTDKFLEHFGLAGVRDLPGIAELKATGLLDANLPPDFKMPEPTDVAALMPDELPLEAGDDGDEDLQPELALEPGEASDLDEGDDEDKPHRG